MIRSFLIGVVAGQRALSPLAAVAVAAARGRLPENDGAPALLASPLVAAGATALAAGELYGDKMKTAPDRTVAPGLIARSLTSAIAGAALAPRERRGLGAALGIAGAVGTSFIGLALRKRAMARWGQTSTGLVEDALVVASAAALLATA